MRRTPDLLSLVTGLVFTGLGVALLVGRSPDLEARWLWPALLIALALALLPGIVIPRDQGGPPPPGSGTGGSSEAL
jgi:hypothetical protein